MAVMVAYSCWQIENSWQITCNNRINTVEIVSCARINRWQLYYEYVWKHCHCTFWTPLALGICTKNRAELLNWSYACFQSQDSLALQMHLHELIIEPKLLVRALTQGSDGPNYNHSSIVNSGADDQPWLIILTAVAARMWYLVENHSNIQNSHTQYIQSAVGL